MITKHSELMSYKQMNIASAGKLTFFLDKHSTKEGTWGKLSLQEGVIDFVFLSGNGTELSRIRMNEENAHLYIPPASWHKIIPVSTSFKAKLEFCCMPHRYFQKKYDLGAVHSDLMTFYQTYLHEAKPLSIIDVGCGFGRNLLYLNQMGHDVTGIDHNQTALESIENIAQKEKLLGIKTLLKDLNQPLSLSHFHYDLVISTVALQFLSPSRIPTLLAELQAMTKPNGLHFLVFPVKSESYSLPESFTYLPETKAMYHAYQDSGWSIIDYKESVGHLHKKDAQGKMISGVFAFLVAQKI